MGISGYIVEKYDNMGNAYTCRRLVEEAAAKGVELQVIGVNDVAVTKDGCLHAGKALERRDFLINRYKWGKMKAELNLLATRTYNSHDKYDIYVNKYEQVKNLRSEEFRIPKYVLAMAGAGYENLAESLGSPFVAKGLESSQGREIFLIRNREEWEALGREYGYEKEWLFEEMITGSIGRDMRIYSIRGRAEACMIRTSHHNFRANFALGASVEPLDVTPAIRKIAGDLYEQTRLDFLGIDLLFGEKKPYFCEINVMPGIEGIEKATGVNIAGKILETICGDFGE